ncbi:unnamed protein product, partial [Prorocentrum cordatum]
VFEAMEERAVHPSLFTYNALVSACGRSGDARLQMRALDFLGDSFAAPDPGRHHVHRAHRRLRPREGARAGRGAPGGHPAVARGRGRRRHQAARPVRRQAGGHE